LTSEPLTAVSAIICAPLGRDAQILSHITESQNIPSRVVKSLCEIPREEGAEAAFLLASEEAFTTHGVAALKQLLRDQEPWSDLPVILLSTGGAIQSPPTSRALQELIDVGNLYVVERPARKATLGAVLRVAFNARRRQFQARDLILQERVAKQQLEKTLGDLRNAQEAQRLLIEIVNSSEDAIISKNLDGVVTSWNGGAERLFGYSRAEAVGQSITLIIPAERLSEEAAILQKIRRGEAVEHFETIRQRKDKTLVDISVSISPIRNADGAVVGASKVARNISQRKRSEEAVRESERRFRDLAERLDTEVKLRTADLQKRSEEVERQAQELRALSVRLMTTQDEVRRYVARELHDSAGQTLTALGMSLGSLVRNIKTQAPGLDAEAEELRSMLSQLHGEIRTASYLLHPPLLDEAGLRAAVGEYVDGLAARSGLSIDLQLDEEIERLSPELELVIFRVIQESLTNVVRHSGSKRAAVRIARNSEGIVVEVRDFGHGMPPDRLAAIRSQGSGVGIRGMRERVRHFGGEMIIDSDTGGTTIRLSFPIRACQ